VLVTQHKYTVYVQPDQAVTTNMCDLERNTGAAQGPVYTDFSRGEIAVFVSLQGISSTMC